jgi:hypothetical protein
VPKFTVLGRFEVDRISAIVPPDYRGLIRAVVRGQEPYTVVLFPHDRDDVVTSAPVRRALASIGAGERVLAVGSNFTVEAIALLDERKAAIARLGEFYWTDESYNTLR